MPSQDDNFGYDRMRAALLALLLLAFAGLTLYVFATAGPIGAGGALVVAILFGTLAAGLAGLRARLVWDGPVLSIGPGGILDRRIGPKRIPWSRVAQIYVLSYRRSLHLAVIVDGADEFVDPPNLVERYVLWSNQALRLPRFTLPLSGLDASPTTILMAVGRHLPQHVEAAEPKKRRWL